MISPHSNCIQKYIILMDLITALASPQLCLGITYLRLMNRHIYLDYNATTPVDPEVLEVMLPYFTQDFANASSITSLVGRRAAQAVGIARRQVANLIQAKEEEIYFTSGATEAINWAIKGIYERYQGVGRHIISCVTEHKAVLDTLASLEKKGAQVTYLPVNADGQIAIADLKKALTPQTILVCLMSANNETGVLHPIDEIAQIAAQHGTLFFCDATQSFGKIPLDLQHTPIDLLCISGHKTYGPKGIGALFIRKKSKRIQVEPLLHGGGQENHLRAGTLNVPSIVGLGKAAERAGQLMATEGTRLEKLRNQLESGLADLPEIYFHGQSVDRLPHVSNFRMAYIPATQIMTRMPDWAMASGSACVTGSREPSHVLMAMGMDKTQAQSALRLSLGRFTTEEEIQKTIQTLRHQVQLLREESPVWQLFLQGLHR